MANGAPHTPHVATPMDMRKIESRISDPEIFDIS
jgi:hypothetical protein